MIGSVIQTEDNSYTVIKGISIDRDNADIYLCEDRNGERLVAKYFCNRTPVSNIGLGVYNHYGRGRDGSERVFTEIKDKSKQHSFLIEHIDRVKYDGSWIIFIEFVEGTILRGFIETNYHENTSAEIESVKALAETLATWHNSGFAHGDPHLENAIIQITNDGQYVVKLIDYGQIHHKDFHYCKEYECFEPNPLRRIYEDLENDSGKLGMGFRADIIELQEDLEIDNILVDAFDKRYKELINFNLQ